MSEISRRNLIGGGAALVGLAAAASAKADADNVQPPFGPPSPPLAGKELPSFRFALGEQAPTRFEGGWLNEAKVEQLPVSETLGGALLQLEPGGLRELHWHANAAEWAYVIDGRCRITIIDPRNQSQTIDFGPGDVWYFPRGYGHSIQAIGDKPFLSMLVFDNGYFGEYGIFSITGWVAATPPAVLAKNFGVPQSTFANFPKSEVFITKGPVPPPLPEEPAAGSLTSGPLSHRYRFLAQKPVEYSGGSLRVVSSEQFPISTTMTGGLLTIRPGALREMHWHPNAAEWQYYLKGTARMTVFGSSGRARTEEFSAGDVGYVPQGYGHYIENTGEDEAELLIVFNNGTYESISIGAWMASNTPELLATNFKVPPATFAGFANGTDLIPD